jgi:membrane protease YdiL (CAAX protease family)
MKILFTTATILSSITAASAHGTHPNAAAPHSVEHLVWIVVPTLLFSGLLYLAYQRKKALHPALETREAIDPKSTC